jgi:hypothetical protein
MPAALIASSAVVARLDNMAGLVLVHCLYDDLTDPTADTAITTHHFEVPITPPTQADLDAFRSAWGAFWLAIRGQISNNLTQNETRFYNVPPGPNPVVGDPIDVDIEDEPGTATSQRLPPQVAISVTEETAIRRRWGRFYLPGLTEAAVNAEGRVETGTVDTIANAAHTMYEAMRTSGREFAVHRRTDGSYQLVRQIRVDNVFDIIRRRRHSVTTYRSIQSIID